MHHWNLKLMQRYIIKCVNYTHYYVKSTHSETGKKYINSLLSVGCYTKIVEMQSVKGERQLWIIFSINQLNYELITEVFLRLYFQVY